MSTYETTGKKMLWHRKTSLTAGLLYLLTFVSIPTIGLYSNAKSANYILGSGSDTQALVGALSEVIVALAGIGTAVVLFRVLKKQNETAGIGLIASRILEASSIFVGVAMILTIVSLRKSDAGPDAVVISNTLTTLYDRIFLVSQSLMPGINDLLLGFMLYKSKLVPRALSMIGMVGAIPLFIGFIAMLFGILGRSDPLVGLSALMVALFEFSLGVWLTFKGFNPKAVADLESKNRS
ncbi:MAG: DUF4386 domain-containing protein [Candidatus Saccharibacteria bacterium]|nr:DUF4386 domain-containing protein [Candidatus Saccharibacteria bacterium]